MKTFKTKAGTELPLIDLRGKDYLQVAHRLVWFREEHPNWSITTEYIQISENHAVAKATIADEKGLIIATAHKHEDRKGFADFLEKAETGSIGRALAACGFGTQFAPELTEAHRIVDSPVIRNPHAVSTAPKGKDAGKIADKHKTSPNEAQLKRLFAIAHQSNWKDDDLRAYLKQMGMESTKELSYMQYDKLCDNMQKYPKPLSQ